MAVDSPSQILNAIAPELSDALEKLTHLELAESQTGKVYGEQRDYAVALLAAHTLTLATRGGASGRATSLQEGQLSVGFNVVGFTGQLSATSYGVELQRLRRQSIMSARTVIV